MHSALILFFYSTNMYGEHSGPGTNAEFPEFCEIRTIYYDFICDIKKKF